MFTWVRAPAAAADYYTVEPRQVPQEAVTREPVLYSPKQGVISLTIQVKKENHSRDQCNIPALNFALYENNYSM